MRIIKKYLKSNISRKIIDDLRLKEQYNTGIPKLKINLLENTPKQPSKFITKIELK